MLNKTVLFLASMALPLAAANAQASESATQPAQDEATSSTTSSDPAADASAGASTQAAGEGGAVSAASAADFTAGAVVRDPQGGQVGTVESATATSAVVSTGAHRVQLPVASFGKNGQGLVIALTKAELEAQAAAAAGKTEQ